MNTKRIQIISLGLVVASAGLMTTGCATKKYVEGETAAVHTRVDSVEGQVEENQNQLADHDQRIKQASGTAQEALERALEAGKLAEGKFLYETVLSDDKVRFGFDQADLGEEANAALDEFAAPLVEGNNNVYIEIQGHTDSVGSEKYNYDLGLKRAEAVRRYLSMNHSIALHRISVISYGESAPVVSNDESAMAGAQNRRVVLVVLQ